ncbi:hypothetical protein K9N50_11415 [bacterium]|nr:hypothetical protein [bacterium]
MADTFEIGAEFRVFESPEKNLWACVIGIASKTIHQREAQTKRSERARDRRRAMMFLKGYETSMLPYACEALGWDLQTIKKAALTRNISVPLD